MRRLGRLAVAGLSLTAGLTLSAQAASASTPTHAFRDCLDVAVQQEDVPDAVDSCVAAYLAGLDDSGSEGTVNNGILGTATDGGVNTAILGTADGDGAVNTGILGHASTS